MQITSGQGTGGEGLLSRCLFPCRSCRADCTLPAPHDASEFEHLQDPSEVILRLFHYKIPGDTCDGRPSQGPASAVLKILKVQFRDANTLLRCPCCDSGDGIPIPTDASRPEAEQAGTTEMQRNVKARRGHRLLFLDM